MNPSSSSGLSIFISDLHLGDPSEKKYQLALQFLSSLKKENCKRLILLGDIFDLWVAKHPYFLNKHQNFLEHLRRIQQEGIEVHYFEGNHDLYLSDYFGKVLNLIIHENFFETTWEGVKIRMEHGDLSNPEDRGYLFLRWFLRLKGIRFLLSKLPGSWVSRIGEKASEASRKYTDQLNIDARDKLRSYAQNLAQHKSFNCIITGHTHQKDIFDFVVDKKNCKSINLGSWFSPPEALVLNSSGEFYFTKISEAMGL